MWLLMTLGALANQWEGVEADVMAERSIAAPAEAIWAEISDLERLREHLPRACVQDWVMGDQTAGIGANARVTYRIGWWRARLGASIVKAEEPRWLDLHHDGKQGFTMRFKLEPVGDRTRVSARSYVAAPPWPARGYYHRTVRPRWTVCMNDALASIEQAAGSRPGGRPAGTD